MKKESYTHNHFTALFEDHLGEPVPEEIFWTSMVQEKITEADIPTIRVGATPSRLISDPSPLSSIFTLDALPAATIPLYPGLGQAPSMLACIPSGVVAYPVARFNKEAS